MKIFNLFAKGSSTAHQCQWPFAIIFASILSLSTVLAEEKPRIMLAENYQQGINTSEYFVSEKLDGVRARWDGRRLISRGGNVFATPEWFTKDFPGNSLDGELWMGRGRYEETASIVRKQQPHEGWRNIRLMVFDLPEHGGTFDERVIEMNRLATEVASAYLGIIEQQSIATEEALKVQLQTVVAQGGEGLMLNRKTARYASGRSQDLLKLKPFDDAEATVIGYRPGKGKYTGHVGSLKVRTNQGIVFFIGTGLSDAQRRNPPPLQSQITFRYQGITKNGIPRFPVFLRIWDEQPE
jgi:DNA ligase-1